LKWARQPLSRPPQVRSARTCINTGGDDVVAILNTTIAQLAGHVLFV
jgi:hypothetical protein